MEDIRRDLARPQSDLQKADLLLELGLDYVLKPGEYATDLDSALLLTKQAEKINERLQEKKLTARIDFVYANALREGGKSAQARRYIERSLALYRTLQEPEAAGLAWLEMTNYYSDDIKQIGEKKACYDSARFWFKEAGDKQNEAFALKNMGDCDQVMDSDPEAMKELLEALAIYKSIGYKDLQGVYDLLGAVATVKGDYSDAVKYGLEALRTAEEGHDTSLQLCTIYNRLGLAYSNLWATDQSLFYWNKALDVAKKYHALPEMRVVMFNLCFGYTRAGKYQEIIRNARAYEAILNGRKDRVDSLYLDIGYTQAYTKLGEKEKAGKKAAEIVSLLQAYPEWRQQMDIAYPVLARYYMSAGQNENAKKYAMTLRDNSLHRGMKKNIAKAYELMASVDSAVGDYKAAFADYKNYKRYTDSMLNESTGFQFAEKQVEFETEKKDNDIRLLKQQEEIQKARLAETRATNTVVVTGIAVLGLLFGLLYNRYWVNQRLNKELQDKQQLINEKNDALYDLVAEKEGLVREMHHRVKNSLQIIMSLQNSQAAYLKDETAKSAIRMSQHRLQAISLLHRKLYQSENLTDIDMRSYIGEVTDYLAGNMEIGKRIHIEVRVSPMELDVSQAVPLGLIINEAVTNAIKYAFRDGHTGEILVALEMDGDGRLELTVSDNGAGLPEGFDTQHLPSLGMSLMKGLCKQLDGELRLINRDGLIVNVRFKPARSYHSGDRPSTETNGKKDTYRRG